MNTKEVGERLTIGPAGRFCASQTPQLCLAAARISLRLSPPRRNTRTVCDLMGAPCSHESSILSSCLQGVGRGLFCFIFLVILLVLCSLRCVDLHQVPELRLEKCWKVSLRRVCGCDIRVLRVPSHGFLVLSSLFLRHGSQIQSTIHQLETYWKSRH